VVYGAAVTWTGYVVKTRLPGLGQAAWLVCAVQARLYGLHMEELEKEGKKKLFTQMSRVQSATGDLSR
jgi:hypothetical protein